VVIHRLPKMMEKQWAAEIEQYSLESPPPSILPDASANRITSKEAFNLWTPRSRCPACEHEVNWYENVPVLSYLFLRGRCSACKCRISPRYPLVELLTGSLFYFCGTQWGVTVPAAIWCAFSAALVALAFIDWDTTLLPDDITLPLLWGGLLAAALGYLSIPLFSSVMGAVGGYLSLWTVYWAFKLATGKEGMGYGDFKLFAALGAWFGWQALIPIILIASVIGALVGICMKLNKSLRQGAYVPFGPFLVGAGFMAMIFGPDQILRTVLGVLGL